MIRDKADMMGSGIWEEIHHGKPRRRRAAPKPKMDGSGFFDSLTESAKAIYNNPKLLNLVADLAQPYLDKHAPSVGKTVRVARKVHRALKGKGEAPDLDADMEGGFGTGRYEGEGRPKKVRREVGPNDGRRKRAEIVKKIMNEKGMKMIEASAYVKAHGLYKP